MKKTDFKDGRPVMPKSKKKGKKLDVMKVLAKAYKKPQRVAEVGGIGHV
jgi:hypothetical protein